MHFFFFDKSPTNLFNEWTLQKGKGKKYQESILVYLVLVFCYTHQVLHTFAEKEKGIKHCHILQRKRKVLQKRLLGIHIGRPADNFSATTSDERQKLQISWKLHICNLWLKKKFSKFCKTLVFTRFGQNKHSLTLQKNVSKIFFCSGETSIHTFQKQEANTIIWNGFWYEQKLAVFV